MGSEEGFNVADKARDSIATVLLTLLWRRCLQRWQVFEAIKAASNAGSWVLLKRCGGSVQAMKSCSHYRCAKRAQNGFLSRVSRNVHLAIKWLSELVRVSEPSGDASSASLLLCKEKKLYGMNPQQNFRLFLTMEFNPRTGETQTGICRLESREDTSQFDPPLPCLRLRATFRSRGPAAIRGLRLWASLAEARGRSGQGLAPALLRAGPGAGAH